MTSRPALLLCSGLVSLLLAGCGSSGGSDPIIGHETKDDAIHAWLRSLGIATSSHTDITLCGRPPANA